MPTTSISPSSLMSSVGVRMTAGRRLGLRVRMVNSTPRRRTPRSADTSSSLRAMMVALAHQGRNSG